MNVDTGLQPIGQASWGTHFCHFYRDAADLSETLVPFFKKGMESNEACLWVTAEPFTKEAALANLRVYFDDLDARQAKGQLAIFDHTQWYERYGDASRGDVVGMWVDAKQKAMHRGYRGLRLSGNTAFLREEDWDDFNAYETAVRSAFEAQEIIGLCSYQADRWRADAVLDVIASHDFALARRRGAWELIESASVKKTKDALAALNADLERRVEQRTRALNDALAHQTTLTAELSHRVKNTIASVQSIVDQTLRGVRSPHQARTTIAGRLSALGRAHDQLSAGHWTGVSLQQVIDSVIAPFGARVRLQVTDETLTARAALDLSLVFHELMTNAAKYGALRSETGLVSIQAGRASTEADYVIRWRESGGPAVEAPARTGFGTRLVRELVAHDLRGECEFAFEPTGLTCTICIPAKEFSVRAGACTHGCPH